MLYVLVLCILSSECWTDVGSKRVSYVSKEVSRCFFTCFIEELAYNFAQNEFLPNAAKWDAEKIFPKDTLRECAALGFGGVFVDPNFGGSGLSRQDGVVIFEALATGCPSTTAFLTIHNMCVWMIDTYGSDQQKQKWLPKLLSCEASRKLVKTTVD